MISGTLAKTLSESTLSAAATLSITGSLGATLRAATLSSAATLSITGAASVTLRDATLFSYDVPLQHAIISQRLRNLPAGPVRRGGAEYFRRGAARAIIGRWR